MSRQVFTLTLPLMMRVGWLGPNRWLPTVSGIAPISLRLRRYLPRMIGTGCPSMAQPKLPSEKAGAPPRLSSLLLLVEIENDVLTSAYLYSSGVPVMVSSMPLLDIRPTFSSCEPPNPSDGIC